MKEYTVTTMEDVKEEEIVPKVIDAFRHVDDRGVLTQTFGDNFTPKRCYEIKDRAGVIRGMHGHKKESKLIYVSKGLVKFVIYEMTSEDEVIPLYDFTLSSDKPQTLLIPAGYYHGFKSLKSSVIHFYSDATLEESKKDDYRAEVDTRGFKVMPR